MPSSRYHARVPLGFTLIEVMVAVAIFAMITTLIYGGFAQTSKNKARIERDLDRSRALYSTVSRLTDELSMAYVSAQLNPAMSLQMVRTAFVGTDRGKADRLDFTSFSHRRLYANAHESDQQELSYFMAKDPADPTRHVLARRAQRRVDDNPRKGGNVEVLLDGVLGFDIKYLDPLSGEWLSSWSTVQAIGQPNRLPAQVKITLSIENPAKGATEPLTLTTRIPIRIRYALNHAIYNP
jgi:general secretion pathway protein J